MKLKLMTKWWFVLSETNSSTERIYHYVYLELRPDWQHLEIRKLANGIAIKAIVMLLIISNIKQAYVKDCNYEYFQLLKCSGLFIYICRYD